MKRGLILAAMLGVAGMAAGCEELQQQFARDPQQPSHTTPPQQPRPTLATGAQASADDASIATPNDSTAQAVRDYLANLETARANGRPPLSADAPAEAEADHSIPDDFETNTARANQPVELRLPHAAKVADVKKAPGPAPPVVLATSLVGDPAATGLEPPPAEANTLGVHRGLDTATPPRQAGLEALIQQAEAALAEDPASAEKQWRLSLLQLAAGRLTEATLLSPAIAQESRALIERSIRAAGSAGRLLTDPLTGTDEALADVDRLRTLLRADAELSIPMVALCSKVTTFGVYEELPAEALVPYQANRVIVYCELKNFSYEDDGSGRYHSQLAARLELFTEQGRSLWVRQEHKIEDFSRQQREDFFLAQLVTLPADLAPGDYVLKVTVTDLLATKTNQALHDFAIPGVGPTTLAVP